MSAEVRFAAKVCWFSAIALLAFSCGLARANEDLGWDLLEIEAEELCLYQCRDLTQAQYREAVLAMHRELRALRGISK